MKWIRYIGGGFLSVLALAVIVLLILGQRSGAGTGTASIDIQRPPEVVWTWIREPDRVKQWVSWLVEVREQEPNRHVWVMEDQNNGGQRMEIVGTVVEADAPRRQVVRLSTPGMFDGEQSYTLEPLAHGGTRLTVRGHYHYQMWFAQLLEPLVTPSARKKMMGDLARLKQKAEATSAPQEAAAKATGG